MTSVVIGYALLISNLSHLDKRKYEYRNRDRSHDTSTTVEKDSYIG